MPGGEHPADPRQLLDYLMREWAAYRFEESGVLPPRHWHPNRNP